MSLENIISVSGLPGLYKVVGQTNNGIVVENIEDGKRQPVYASHKVSALEDISMFTTTEDIPLKDVFQKMYENNSGKETISYKSSGDELKVEFEKALKDYDQDRVYTSDIKKVIRWYNLLVNAGFLTPEKKEEEKEEKKPTAKAKPKKKATTKEKE
eukprot:gnl/MRDRNA2_/MRDRNA2_142339_c0_seq1.p1 gnl/MRDRNA2_/MRDRNA2_142339_c0~~gnl/MRDRNA2_/MRDRNA2_142339_c0_seq1.p1  ORF type:complete len:156 (-),score=21.07 gnl/MRDRNA2_/MRDRNA2_142339_c0_seq1:140-607(-)